jgi:2-polyprenyl-6-methoxyphenol hydroxylase-like FAD-dependent oxidoreductase
MGLEEAIRSKVTKEKGLAFVDAKGNRKGSFPENGGASFTCDIEILRENLARIFFDATKDKVEYIFGDHVIAIDQKAGKKVRVTLEKGGEKEYDLVIGADGLSSKTRRLAFPPGEPKKNLGMYSAFFTIPLIKSEGDFAEWYNAPGGRNILLRPDNAGYTRSYLSVMSSKPAGYEKLDVPAQKKMMR